MKKPLFIPLKELGFHQFATLVKVDEFRPEGPRWNAETCRIGRPVVLSCGYGVRRRLAGIVAGYRVVGPDADAAIPAIYPGVERIAAIRIRVHPEVMPGPDALRMALAMAAGA